MNRVLVFVCAVGIGLAGCQKQPETAVPRIVYGSSFNAVLEQQAENRSKRRTPVEFESGATVQTCDDYVRALANSRLKEDVNNQIAKNEYLACEALSIVGQTGVERGRQDVTYGQTLADRLDLRSFPSSMFQVLDDKRHTLSAFNAKALKIEPTAVTYETPDVHFRLELVATLDVNGNGKTDWVLWLADEAKSGNYRQYQTLVAFDVPGTGLIVAGPYHAGIAAGKK